MPTIYRFDFDSRVEEKFYARVAPMMDDRGCWEWVGASGSTGYGSLSLYNAQTQGTHPFKAHRVSYALHNGNPAGKVVRHTCDNPTCVNPAHLLLGTHADNVHDTIARGHLDIVSIRAGHAQKYGYSSTHCAGGHPRTPENTRPYIKNAKTYTYCRICRYLQLRNRRALLKEVTINA